MIIAHGSYLFTNFLAGVGAYVPFMVVCMSVYRLRSKKLILEILDTRGVCKIRN